MIIYHDAFCQQKANGECVAVCCSVLQCVDMKQIASVLQCLAVSCSVLQYVDTKQIASVLQCVAVC